MRRNYGLIRTKYKRGETCVKYYRVIVKGKDSYYTKYEELDNGFAKVMKNGKWGILNPNGTVWGRMEYSKIPGEFHEDMIRVEKDNKVGFADRESGRFIECIFDEAYDFENGYAKVVYKQRECYINRVGKII